VTPLVLIHGFTGSPASWAWVGTELSGSRAATDVLAPALIGHDGTPGPAHVRTFSDEVDRLAREIRQAARGRTHLVGYSMGGRVALGLLLRHPDLFSAATLIGASPGLADPAERAARERQDQEWIRLLESEALDTFVAAWEALPLFAGQDRADPAAVARQRGIRRSHDPRGLARALRVLGLAAMPDHGPALGAVSVPVRVVAGGLDHKFVDLGRDLAARLPGGRLHIIEGAGHNVVLERPSELARLLEETES
jgi:2-succinyl-6-hydroxy-2,4-cyclohexadiene-1-carboxylate synthase